MDLDTITNPYDDYTEIRKREKSAHSENDEFDIDVYVWNGTSMEKTTPFTPITIKEY